MNPGYPKLMPNFSHGTAGISYFLAELYRATGEKAFLEGALSGAAYLLKITNDNGLIFHHEPDGEDLFYLGWCHGPTGTGRLYYRLWKETGDEKWRDALIKSADGLMKTGIPEKRTTGFWNNESICCGTAGVADYFLSLHEVLGDEKYLAFARRATKTILSNAVQKEKGISWVQAEHRVKPLFLEEQTGYMQGASGIALWLLRLENFEEEKKPTIVLPDSPFYNIK